MADKTVTVKSTGGDYTTVSAALAGESTNLVTNTCILTIECYDPADTIQIETGSGYTTNSSYYVHITVPQSIRHAGVWDTNKWVFQYAGTHFAIYLCNYLHISGFQLERTSGDGGFFNFLGISASYTLNISNCILKGCGGTTYRQILYSCSTGSFPTINMWNCLAYNTGSEWGSYQNHLEAQDVVNLYNCTIINGGADFGIRREAGTLTLKNCYVGGSLYGDYTGAIALTTCASSDSTGTSGLRGILASTTADSTHAGFVNVTSSAENFHIKTDSPLKGVGTTNPASGLFSDDIDGVVRTGSWDIGADQYVASTSVALSGTATNSITETDIVTGGKTVILTLTGDTWISN